MRRFAFLFLILSLSYCHGQRPNGVRRGNTNNNSQPAETPKFESKKIAGIFEYSSKKVLKKLKLKKNDSVSKAVEIEINNYNTEITKIKVQNKDLFEGLDIVVNQNVEIARKNKNRELMRETMVMVREKLQPIQEKILAQEELMNLNLKNLLSEEQNKKWLDYQRSEKEKLMPQRRSNDARNRPDDLIERRGRRRG